MNKFALFVIVAAVVCVVSADEQNVLATAQKAIAQARQALSKIAALQKDSTSVLGSDFTKLSNPVHNDGAAALGMKDFFNKMNVLGDDVKTLPSPIRSAGGASVMSADTLQSASTTCSAYTGQSLSGNVQLQIFEANAGKYLTQVTAAFSNNPQTLAFASTTPVTLNMASVQSYQGGFMGLLNYGNSNWDINGGYGGIFTQKSSPSFYVNVIPNGSGGVSIKAVQTNYNSNQYNLNLMNINGQSELSYGNINANGNFQVYVCPQVYTGQAISSPVRFSILEQTSGKYLTQVTAAFSINPQTLSFSSSTPVIFTMTNPTPFQGGFMGLLNYGNTNWDINGGYGGIFTQNSNPSFYVNVIPNGSGGVLLKAVQTNYNSNQYNLDLMNINGQSELSYGNLNGKGNYVVSIY